MSAQKLNLIKTFMIQKLRENQRLEGYKYNDNNDD